MQHLVRAGLLLGALVLLFVGVRAFFIPDSWGDYGYYRADNVKEWTALPVQYAETNMCQACHTDKYKLWTSSGHANVSCENCHGAAQPHIDRGTPLSINRTREACATCHNRTVGRPVTFPQIDVNSHGGNAACITCHNPHSPLGVKTDGASSAPTLGPVKAAIAQTSGPPAIPHTLDGRSSCLACHGGGGLKPVPADHNGRSESICLGCHRSKA